MQHLTPLPRHLWSRKIYTVIGKEREREGVRERGSERGRERMRKRGRERKKTRTKTGNIFKEKGKEE